VLISNDGLTRPGQPAAFSTAKLNTYLTQHKVSSFAELPDGNLAIGTLSGGLILASRAGEAIRIWADSGSGLPSRAIIGLAADSSGEVLGTSPTDFFHFPAGGERSVFNTLNGLRSEVVNRFAFWKSTLYAATDDGTYRQTANADQEPGFEPIASLAVRYNDMRVHGDGMLLTRFGGVDWFDGTTTRPVYQITASSAFQMVPTRADPNVFYVTESGGLARLTPRSGGSFERDRFLELSDNGQPARRSRQASLDWHSPERCLHLRSGLAPPRASG
jgi:hypothetical protein